MNIIGISGSIFEEGSLVKSFVNRTYVDSVVRAGGVDIHPFKFNEEPNPKIGEISKERDDFDFLVMKHAFENNKPIFGICRGIQFINVFFSEELR